MSELWTQAELDLIKKLSKEGMKSRAIAEALEASGIGKRSPGAINAKLGYISERAHAGRPVTSNVTRAELIQRERLKEARAQQSPLSALMGEPPPGWSARDKKGGFHAR